MNEIGWNGWDRDDIPSDWDDAPSPWEVHEEHMRRYYGRRDPECFWCGETVYMALQGFYSGGTWTTDPVSEGPLSVGGDGLATRCPESPDDGHDPLPERAVDSDPPAA